MSQIVPVVTHSLWPATPSVRSSVPLRTARGPALKESQLFPSGRQALIEVLRNAGLGRKDYVAIPEWSSRCVIAAAGTVATPVPMPVAVQSRLRCGAVLIYEQWGWPYSLSAIEAVREAFPAAQIVLDRVDSAVLAPPSAGWRGYEIWSLSKTLGYAGGGLARRDGSVWLDRPAKSDQHMVRSLEESLRAAMGADVLAADVIKFHGSAIPEEAASLISDGQLASAFEAEAGARRARLEILRRMIDGGVASVRVEAAFESGSPGLFPFGIGMKADQIEALAARLRGLGLETARYHFNRADSILAPDYQPCIAAPIHSGVPEEKLSRLGAPSPVSFGGKKSVIVAGGGVAGLYLALRYAARGCQVSLVEREASIGGMLRSVPGDNGMTFDIGTHFAVATGNAEIDSMLFEELDPLRWSVFTNSLKEGHYWNGILNTDTGCIDIRSMPDAELAQAVSETLGRASAPAKAATVRERLLDAYGPVITERVFAPVLLKLTGEPLERLAPDIVDVFSLSRLVVVDGPVAKALKRDPVFDAKIAYAHRDDGQSSIKKYYPRQGGIGAWMEALANKLQAMGGQIQLDRSISSIKIDDDAVGEVGFSNGEAGKCDKLVWTGTTESLLKLMKKPIQGRPPKFRDLLTYNIVSDRVLASDLHWVCNYDASHCTYRVTLYPNMTENAVTPPYHLTVEVVADKDAEAPAAERIFDELRTMGLVQRDATLQLHSHHRYRNALPISAPDQSEHRDANRLAAAAIAGNILLAGRASGHFHQAAVLQDAHRSLAQAFE